MLGKSALNIALPLDGSLSGPLMYSAEGAAEPLHFGVQKHSSNARNQDYSHAHIPLRWICCQNKNYEKWIKTKCLFARSAPKTSFFVTGSPPFASSCFGSSFPMSKIYIYFF